MDKTIYKKISQYIEIYYPYLIFFILILFLHLLTGFFADDVTFSNVLSKWSLLGYLKYRYLNWDSRIIQVAALVIFSNIDRIIWKILDSIIYTLGAYYTIKIVNKENNKQIIIFGILLFLMYPFYELGSAGWIATTLTYLWSFSLGMISFIPLINEYYNKKTSHLTYVVSILALLYAVNQEQSCGLIFGFSLLYLINSTIKKEKINKYGMLILLISSLSLLNIITCPGTRSRFLLQLNSKYPKYASFGLLEKIYLGIIPTIEILLTDKLIFPIFYIILSITSLLKTKKKYLKYIFYFNIIFISFIIIYKIIFDIPILQLINIYPLLNSMMLFNYKGVPITISLPLILTLFISLYLIGSSCLMLLEAYDKKIFPLILFCAGFISRFIMGFSPEVFSSGARTAFYFYMILIMLILMLIKKLYNENIINKKVEELITIVFLIFATIEYIYTFILILVRF